MARNIFFLFVLSSFILTASIFASWKLDWTGEPGFENNGVNPDRGYKDTSFEFRIKFYPEKNGVYPEWVKLFIDLNGDGKFEKEEVFELEPSPDDEYIWMCNLELGTKIGAAPHMAYYFQAHADNKIRSSMLAFGPIVEGFTNSFIIEGTGWFIKEALLPMTVRTMEQNERITFINTSGSPLSIALSIPADTPGPFYPVGDINSTETNAYVMSAVITDIETGAVREKDFNQNGSEDVITTEPKRAEGPVFGIGKSSRGSEIPPGESAAIWLQLRSPATASGENALERQWVYIKVEVSPTE
ncbi:hypothetical protein DRQ36_11185 [bacterium]|nr:MAG: hypothetical protein DRQ36_11185 [bacterium]